jgi:hypothetical protein
MARTIGRLTALAVRGLKPGMHPDGGGLYLQISKAGARFSALMPPAWTPERSMVPPCSGPSRRGLETPEVALRAECRPARGGIQDVWLGRKKAWGAVEQKQGTTGERERKLGWWRR